MPWQNQSTQLVEKACMTQQSDAAKAQWVKLNRFEQVWLADYRFAMGWARSVAVEFEAGRFLVYSPGKTLTESFVTELGAKGSVEFLVAPNAFHNEGLDAWQERFPEARVVCAEGARSRVAKNTKTSLQPINLLSQALQDNVQVHLLELPSFRFGELWLVIKSEGHCAWVVCDFFFNLKKPPKQLLPRLMLTLLGNIPGLKVSRVVRWVLIQSNKTFRQWYLQRLNTDRPDTLVVNHGAVLQEENLTERLRLFADQI